MGSLGLLAIDAEIEWTTTHPFELPIMRQYNIWRATQISAQKFHKLLHGYYLKVKFVPRLGPLAVSSSSKKVTACFVVLKVTERRPPYPLFALRH